MPKEQWLRFSAKKENNIYPQDDQASQIIPCKEKVQAKRVDIANIVDRANTANKVDNQNKRKRQERKNQLFPNKMSQLL